MYTASNWRHSTNGFLPKPVLQVEKKNTVGTENFTWAADGKYRSRNQQF